MNPTRPDPTRPDPTRPEGALTQAPDALVLTIFEQAREHLERGSLERAHDAATILVQMRPHEASLWTFKGHICRRLRRYGPALQALTLATQLDPHSRQAMLELGESLCLAGKPVEGLELVRAVFEQGRLKDKPPAQQDHVTQRAGVLLEGVQRSVAAVLEQKAQTS